MVTAARLLRDHESLDWQATFTVGKQQVTATEIKVTGRYADAHGLKGAKVADLFDAVLKRRRLWGAVSIAGRTAYCAALLERARRIWKLTIEPLDQYIEALWEFVSSDDLDAAEQALSAVRVTGPAQLSGLVPTKLVRPMFALLDAAWDAATTELGAGIEDDSPGTRIAVTFAEWTARNARLPLPATKSFVRSRFSELDGWGDRQPRAFYVR